MILHEKQYFPEKKKAYKEIYLFLLIQTEKEVMIGDIKTL